MKLPIYLLASALCLAVAISACTDTPTSVSEDLAASSSAEANTESGDVLSKSPRFRVDICHFDSTGVDSTASNDIGATGLGAHFHIQVNNNSWIQKRKKNKHGTLTGHNSHTFEAGLTVASSDTWFCTDGDDTTTGGAGTRDNETENGTEVCTEDSGDELDGDPNDQARFCYPDTDKDGVDDHEDICEGFDDNVDTDSDGVPDGCDVCPNDPNASHQTAETCDDDEDGEPNVTDNCPDVANSGQENVDGDSAGAACDTCDRDDGSTTGTDGDGDGFCDGSQDCDDTMSGVNPDATEICDNDVDEDCSGVADVCED